MVVAFFQVQQVQTYIYVVSSNKLVCQQLCTFNWDFLKADQLNLLLQAFF